MLTGATVRDVARLANAHGMVPIPVKGDGTKSPALPTWRELMDPANRPSNATLRSWFDGPRPALALVCGTASGGLVALDVEGRAVLAGLWDKVCQLAFDAGLSPLVQRITNGYCEETPGGGVHLLYRVEGATPASQVLAERVHPLDATRRQVLIETRGHGGYVIIAPSNGSTHESGRAWVLLRGGLDTVVTITGEEHAELMALCRLVDEMPHHDAPSPGLSVRAPVEGEETPGDEINAVVHPVDLLVEHGWAVVLERDEVTYVRRPGKERGISATVACSPHGHRTSSNPTVKVFTTSTVLPTNGTLSAFAVMTHLAFGGDFGRCASEWRRTHPGRPELCTPRTTPAPGHPPAASPAPPPTVSPDDHLPLGLFTTERASDLARMDLTMHWLAQGLLVEPTYGQLAGEQKTLKSYLGAFIDVAIASGISVLGRFQVTRPRPVLVYVGEGGRIPYTRRLRRIADSYETPIPDDLFVSFDVATFDDPRFILSLERDLATYEPALVHIDPYYAFHGAGIDSRNLHAEGSLLASLSQRCADRGASLLLTNHWNKTGTGTGLARITQSGSAEWADSWLLVSHRRAPTPDDIAAGRFALTLDVGSRQWGGTTWDLTLEIGRLDPTSGTHDGPIRFDITPHDAVGEAPGGRLAKAEQHIIDLLRDEPFVHTRAQVLQTIRGRRATTSDAFDALIERSRIREAPIVRDEEGRKVTRHLWACADQLTAAELA